MSYVDPFKDPVAFIRAYLRNPETGEPFVLFPAEERFLREALIPGPDGRLRYPELVFSAPKKSGKTMIAAWCVLFVILALAGQYGEAYCVANDEEQAVSRVFEAIVRLIKTNRALQDEVKITERKITFVKTGATITALGADFAGAAGSNPNIACFDENWAYTSERSVRLWDEMVPVPTKRVSVRLSVTYAGFTGESALLEGLEKRAVQGELIGTDLYAQPGMLAYWTHDCPAPWQTEAWKAQMRQQLRPHAYLRMVENRFVSGEEQFIDIALWDRAATEQPIVADRSLPVVLGVDLGLKRDSSAIVVCAWDKGKVRLVSHRIFTPVKGELLDIEETVEEAIREYARRFRVTRIRFDPWQAQRTSELLKKAGLPMEEFPQSVPNLTQMSTNLSDLLRGNNLVAYPDDDIRLALQRAVSVETSRGLKIAKEKASHKIDVVVALAMAALGVVRKPESSMDIGGALAEATTALRRANVNRPELDTSDYATASNPLAAPSKWRGSVV